MPAHIIGRTAARLRGLPAAFAANARRCSSSLPSLPPHRLLPMPRLSPTMTTGTMHRWTKGEGDAVATYDLVFEVTTREILEEPTPNDVVMEIEVHEEGYIAKILAPIGTRVAPDEPMCAAAAVPASALLVHFTTMLPHPILDARRSTVVCEEAEGIAAFADYKPPAGTLVSAGLTLTP